MSYLASVFIARAFKLGLSSADMQNITDKQIQTGLYLLNEILDEMSYETDLIPFWSYYTGLSTVPGQEVYLLRNIVAVESITFQYDPSLRLAMRDINRYKYDSVSRAQSITSLPLNYSLNRVYGGTELRLYYVPDRTYPLNIRCKFMLQDVSLTTDMSINMEGGLLSYIRHALGCRIAIEYRRPISNDLREATDRIYNRIFSVSPRDFSMRRSSICNNNDKDLVGLVTQVKIGMPF